MATILRLELALMADRQDEYLVGRRVELVLRHIAGAAAATGPRVVERFGVLPAANPRMYVSVDGGARRRFQQMLDAVHQMVESVQ